MLTITLISVFAVTMSGMASAAPGDIDLSFGDAGAKSIPVGGSADVGGIVARADGSSVIAGSVDTSVVTVALKRNGQLLGTYGSGGISSVPVPGSTSVTITDAAMRADERLVAAGYEDVASGSPKFIVARFRPGGAPDHSFSGDGVAKIPFTQGTAYGYGVAIQPDGKIVVVGEVDPVPGVSNPAIARLNQNGSLDESFGVRGRKVIKLPDGVKDYDGLWRVVLQAKGRLAMAGWVARGDGTYRTLAMRLKAGGVLDRTFNGDGIAVIDADGTDNWSFALAKDDDKLVLGVHTDAGAAGFIRLSDNGTRDKRFGGDGIVIHTLSVPWEVIAVAVRADHRIVGANDASDGPNIVQLKSGGKVDGGFGTGGEAFGPLMAAASDVIILPNGKVVAAGPNGSEFMAARFQGP